MNPPENDHRTPSEARLDSYLEELREHPPNSNAELTKHVTRRARWQSGVRGPLQAFGLLAAAVFDGIAGLFGADHRVNR